MRLPFTDHHIQDTILHELSQGERRFSELLPDGMEHSMFMYHMRKLLAQQVVEKHEDCYRLTLRGAQLYNARYQLRDPMRHPRALIQFVVRDGDKLLLSRRRSHMGEYLNRAMLPGGVHFFMASSYSAATTIARQRGLSLGEFLCSVETIARDNNYHGLIDVYEATIAGELAAGDDHEHVWLPVAEVAAMPFSQVGSAGHIARKLVEGTLRAREVVIVKKAHDEHG